MVFSKAIAFKFALDVSAFLARWFESESDFIHATGLGGGVLGIRVGGVVEVGCVVTDELLLDGMAVAVGIGLEQGIDGLILVVEQAEVGLIYAVDSGVDVAVEDVIGLKLKVLLHGLEIFWDVCAVLIQYFERLIGTVIDFIVKAIPMFAKINKPVESFLREWNIDFVVDLGEVLTSSKAFRSDHEISDGKDNCAIREAIGIKSLVGNNLFKEDGVGPFVDWIIASFVGQQGLVNHITIYPGNVGMKRIKIPLKGFLKLILHVLCRRSFNKEVDEVVMLLRQWLLLEIASNSLVILLVTVLLILTVFHADTHFKLELNPTVEDEDIEVEHFLKQQSVVAVHHIVGVSHPSLITIISNIVGCVHPVKE